jgi:hypothetical protein
MRGTRNGAWIAGLVGVAMAALLAISVTACGSDDGAATADSTDKKAGLPGMGKFRVVPGSAAEEEAQVVYGRFMEAHLHGRGEQACSMMTQKSRVMMTQVKPELKLSCAQVMEKIAEDGGQYFKPGRLLGATVPYKGNPTWAIVKYDDGYSTPSDVPLTRINGKWHVDAWRNQHDIGTPSSAK